MIRGPGRGAVAQGTLRQPHPNVPESRGKVCVGTQGERTSVL